MGIAQIIALITGAAENVVPIFIHNPTSQKIEGVIIGDVNAVLSALVSSLLSKNWQPMPPGLK